MPRRLITRGFQARGDCKSPCIVWRLGACLLRVSAQAGDVVLDLGLSFEFIHGECVCVYIYICIYIYILWCIYTHYTCVYIYIYICTVYRYLDR